MKPIEEELWIVQCSAECDTENPISSLSWLFTGNIWLITSFDALNKVNSSVKCGKNCRIHWSGTRILGCTYTSISIWHLFDIKFLTGHRPCLTKYQSTKLAAGHRPHFAWMNLMSKQYGHCRLLEPWWRTSVKQICCNAS